MRNVKITFKMLGIYLLAVVLITAFRGLVKDIYSVQKMENVTLEGKEYVRKLEGTGGKYRHYNIVVKVNYPVEIDGVARDLWMTYKFSDELVDPESETFRSQYGHMTTNLYYNWKWIDTSDDNVSTGEYIFAWFIANFLATGIVLIVVVDVVAKFIFNVNFNIR